MKYSASFLKRAKFSSLAFPNVWVYYSIPAESGHSFAGVWNAWTNIQRSQFLLILVSVDSYIFVFEGSFRLYLPIGVLKTSSNSFSKIFILKIFILKRLPATSPPN